MGRWIVIYHFYHHPAGEYADNECGILRTISSLVVKRQLVLLLDMRRE